MSDIAVQPRLHTQRTIMGNDLTIKKPKNLAVINENNMSEILWWSSQLGVSPEKIFATIREVGSAAEKVRARVHSRNKPK
jgi:hypothetical protein